MKASTLFSVTVALFLGLAVAVGAKYSGLLNPKPPAPVPPPRPKSKVLVAAKNLFESYTILQGDVLVRDMSDEEEAHYREHKDQYLTPKPEVAILRVLNRSIEADQPILRDYLDDVNLPQAINQRLSSPTMRAVNVTVPPGRAAGGLIQRNEYVDVYLTTRIFVLTRRRNMSTTQTAAIARNLKVIVKRNMLWDAVVPLDPSKPIEFTLEANVYRAALIEYAKGKGELSLVPTATPKDAKGSRKYVSGSQNDPSSKEYQNEDERIEACQRGEYTVGDADLERIFNLKAPNMPGFTPPIEIEQYTGNRFRGVQSFDPNKGKSAGFGVVSPNTGQASNYSFGPLNSKAPSTYGEEGSGNNNPLQHPLTLSQPRDTEDNYNYNNNNNNRR